MGHNPYGPPSRRVGGTLQNEINRMNQEIESQRLAIQELEDQRDKIRKNYESLVSDRSQLIGAAAVLERRGL